jgi:hypothetical protein
MNAKQDQRPYKGKTKTTVIIKPLVLAETIRVIGTTVPTEGSGREVVVEIGTEKPFRVSHFPLAAIGSGDLRPLAMELAEAGQYHLAIKPTLCTVANYILAKARNTKTLVITATGLTKVMVDGQPFYAYVWSGRIYWFGPAPAIKVLASKGTIAANARGTFEEWRVRHEGVLPGNPYMIFTYVQCLAAPLRRRFGKPQLSVILVGASTTGKSTTQKAAQSIIGDPDEVITMSGTRIGILDHLASKPDQPAFLQDTRQSDSAADLLNIIFEVADGAGRLRRGESPRKIAASMILSNERNLIDMAGEKKGSLDDGIFSRVLEINLTRTEGAFHHFHGEPSAADFATKLEQIYSECYGTAWPVWLKALSDQWPTVEQLYEKWLPLVKAKIAKYAGAAEISAISNRLLDALAFSAWAGCIASRFGILPIERAEITDAFGLVFAEHVALQLKATTPVGDKLIKDVRGFLDENYARFPDLKSFDSDTPRPTVYGYRRVSRRHGDVFLFLPNVFDRQFVAEYGNVAYSILKRADFLVANDGGGNQYLTRIPNTYDRKRFVAIKASIRFDSEKS